MRLKGFKFLILILIIGLDLNCKKSNLNKSDGSDIPAPEVGKSTQETWEEKYEKKLGPVISYDYPSAGEIYFNQDWILSCKRFLFQSPCLFYSGNVLEDKFEFLPGFNRKVRICLFKNKQYDLIGKDLIFYFINALGESDVEMLIKMMPAELEDEDPYYCEAYVNKMYYTWKNMGVTSPVIFVLKKRIYKDEGNKEKVIDFIIYIRDRNGVLCSLRYGCGQGFQIITIATRY